MHRRVDDDAEAGGGDDITFSCYGIWKKIKKDEQFKHKESEFDAATGQRKGLAAVGLSHDDEADKSDSPGFNAIYGQTGGKAGTDEKYSGGKSGTVGVPDYNKNSFGIKYVKTNKNGQFWCEQHQAWETEQSHNQPPSGVGR